VSVGLAWLWGGFWGFADPRGTCICPDWLCGVAMVSWGFELSRMLVVALGWVYPMVCVVGLGCP
jgi:hypothetical protein